MTSRTCLVGRDDELAALDAHQRGSGGALVIVGEAGAGKTALWHESTQRFAATGVRTLVATPGEGEARSSGAVLLDLFRDVELEDLGLDPVPRQALEAVLLRGPAVPDVPSHGIAVGVCGAIGRLLAAGPVVVAVDDVQWADATSLQALTFAARRLAEADLRFLLTRRSTFDPSPLEQVLGRSDIRSIEPRPLTPAEVARLLVERLDLRLIPRAARAVHERSRGNPLFALEIGRAMVRRGVRDPGGIDGATEVAGMLGLRVRDLPPEQQTALLAVALDPQLSEGTLAGVVGSDAIVAAVRDGVVTLDRSGRVRAGHPLLAAAAMEAATTAAVRALHRELAAHDTRPAGRSRHLALSSDAPDEALAALLAAESQTAAARGAVETAIELARLALARTPAQAVVRPQRVLDLAGLLVSAADTEAVTDLLELEIPAMPHGSARGRAWLLRRSGMVRTVPNAVSFGDRALAECGGSADVRAAALDYKAALTAHSLVLVDQGRIWAEEARALGFRNGPGLDWCLVAAGEAPVGGGKGPLVRRLEWRGELARAETLLLARIAAAEAENDLFAIVDRRLILVEVLARSGRVRDADRMLDAVCEADLVHRESSDVDLARALIEVQAGRTGLAADLALAAQRGVREIGHRWQLWNLVHVHGVALLIDGRYAEAEAELRECWEGTVAAGVRDPGAFPLAPDLVEAQVALGHLEDAGEVLTWLDARAAEQDHPWGLATAERLRHLIAMSDPDAPLGDAEPRTWAAADALGELGLAVDRGRTLLGLGIGLRRRRQWGGARTALGAAASCFDETGADGWADRARTELAKVSGRTGRPAGELTPAEEAVARLAASGLSNKEIARRTQVSVHTVEVHLGRCYAKLGIRSRSQLAGRLGE